MLESPSTTGPIDCIAASRSRLIADFTCPAHSYLILHNLLSQCSSSLPFTSHCREKKFPKCMSYQSNVMDKRETKPEESVNKIVEPCSEIEQEKDTEESKPSVEIEEETEQQIESQVESAENEVKDNVAIQSGDIQEEIFDGPSVKDVNEETGLEKKEYKEENKIEIQWSDIMALKATYPDDGPGTLNIVDEEVTYRKRKEKGDVREVRRVYHECKDYIIKHGGESTLENRDALIKAGAIAVVLYEVSNTPTKAAGTQGLKIDEPSETLLVTNMKSSVLGMLK
ncbi:hypothetical protein L1887_32333 [Cichorium endivia]|nr:hypothetical protein L1887_32333 [Cichorium endivia]